MSSERAQSVVEAVFIIPLCGVCALLLIEGGVFFRNNIIVTQAATQAAYAELEGRDPLIAAKDSVPPYWKSRIKVQRTTDKSGGKFIKVSADARSILNLDSILPKHQSSVQITQVAGTK